MKNNVCKFPSHDVGAELSIFCFVLETDITRMTESFKLKHNRMILIEQGSGKCCFDSEVHQFAPGTLLFGFEGEAFRITEPENVRYLYIDFGGGRGDSLLRRFGIFSKCRKKDNLNELIPFCTDSLLRSSEENIDIAAETVLLYVLSRISVGNLARNDVLQKIIEITEENFRDPEFSMAVLADKIGYNPKYLSNFFKKKMNVPYTEYLRSVRFKYAVSLIELGIISVKNVAFLSGFSDSLYFSNTFKKAIGVSPKEFIKRLSESNAQKNDA